MQNQIGRLDSFITMIFALLEEFILSVILSLQLEKYWTNTQMGFMSMTDLDALQTVRDLYLM